MIRPEQRPVLRYETPGPRNGRCPLCSSGRKLKKCCLAPPTQATFDARKQAITDLTDAMAAEGVRVVTA